MTMPKNLPPEFPLPPERLQAQRRLVARAVTDHRRRGPRTAQLRLAGAAALLAVIVAMPAFGIGERIVNQFDAAPLPEAAQKQTGVAARAFSETTYDGFLTAVDLYKDTKGRTCLASRFGTRSDGTGVQYECFYDYELFQGPRPDDPRQPIDIFGPASAQEPNRVDYDATNWDKMWFYGLTVPDVVRVTVVMTDCSKRPVQLDAQRFEGKGVFLYVVARRDLRARVWPHKLVAEDATGAVIYDKPIPGIAVPTTPEALEQGTRRPQPQARCS